MLRHQCRRALPRHGLSTASHRLSPGCLRSRLLITPSLTFQRGKKTKTTLKLSDLPQGIIPSEPLPDLQPAVPDEPTYPTVVLQAKQNMQKFSNCVLLTRVGGFYELYFEHADEYGPLLNLKVASKKTAAGPVSMAGFPFFQLERYLKTLVQDLNKYVAIAEEFPNEASDRIKTGGLMHDRRVARIVTPGTLIDEGFIDPYANNYVMSVHMREFGLAPVIDEASDDHGIPEVKKDTNPLGVAWLDLSTGQFFTQATDMASLPSILSRIGPREVVLDRSFESQPEHGIFTILAEDRHLITYADQGDLQSLGSWTPFLESQIPASSADKFTQDEVLAGGLVLEYVKGRLQGLSMRLQPPMRHENMHIMNIDKNSMRALEVKATMRDGFFRGSLLHAIRRTVTKSGARLLSNWLSAPSTDLDVIRGRQHLVASFIEAEDLRDGVILLLRRSHDSQRLVQKFVLSRGDPDDLLDLANTISATEDIVRLLQSSVSGSTERPDCLAAICERINLVEPLKLASRIREAIDEDSIIQQHEEEDAEASQMAALAEEVVTTEGSQEDAASLPKGKRKKPTSIKEYYAEDRETWIMKPAASPALQRLHNELNAMRTERDELVEFLRDKLNASTLTLRWTPGLGHIAHIKGKDMKGSYEYRALSASRSTRSFHIPEWTSLGQRLDHIRLKIRSEEQRVFQSLREHVIKNLVKLRRNAAVLDELDITTSFAKLAVEQNLIRPELNDSTAHTIMGGRHPTVEGGLYEQGRSFVKNDCLVGGPNSGRLWLITGPNMAGKSTFLRQNALITIMAQVGCYVPAAFAAIGIVDAIFSRVGSADNLYRDQSTFMVEMLETAHILKTATPRSFVIMDEIGRGTTPEDGTGVSFACLWHLVTVNQCRTLFATHFHGVADLAAEHGLCELGEGGEKKKVEDRVRMYCTDVREDGRGGFVYVHKLREGINRSSHALKVAKLAGVPVPAIEMARKVLGH